MNNQTEATFMDAVRAAERHGKRLTWGDVGYALFLAATGSLLTLAAILIWG